MGRYRQSAENLCHRILNRRANGSKVPKGKRLSKALVQMHMGCTNPCSLSVSSKSTSDLANGRDGFQKVGLGADQFMRTRSAKNCWRGEYMKTKQISQLTVNQARAVSTEHANAVSFDVESNRYHLQVEEE